LSLWHRPFVGVCVLFRRTATSRESGHRVSKKRRMAPCRNHLPATATVATVLVSNALSNRGGLMGDDWSRLSDLLDACIEMPPAARHDYIHAKTMGAPELRARALALIDALDTDGDFMTTGGETQTTLLPDDVRPGIRFGAWEVVDVIGRGGMGRVYGVVRIAGGFVQKGALKLIAGTSAVDRRRFDAERQILADIEHPGVARILDGDVTGVGDAWMVMERVDGAPIDTYCAANTIALPDRVRLAISVGEAVAAAHARLILHRDLKPSNILVDGDGRVRVIDFGIAKRVDVGELTEQALPVSAAYAAPELLTGAATGPATDVYGLAATLYELAAGAPPIALGGLPVALGLGRVLDTPPPRLRQHLPQSAVLRDAPAALVSDLEAILDKALRKDAAGRYPTMEALLTDLQRALDGRPVTARDGESGYRLRRFLVRNRWPVVGAGLVAASLVIGTTVAIWQARVATAARDAAVAEANRTEAVRNSVFLLLGEASDAAGPDGSRKDVLTRAATRLTREFQRDPAEFGPIMQALGELYFHSSDYDGAAALLQPVAALPMHAGTDSRLPAPEVIAEAKIDLAQVLIRKGDAAAARPLLEAAQTFWRTDPERWRTDLIDSRITEAQLVRELDKDPERAAALLRVGLADRLALAGPADRDVGIFQNNLGVMLQGNGDLAGAGAAFSAARATWTLLGATETPDALNTLNNLAAIATLQGHPDRAEPLFREAVAVRRSLFGPSAALAALINNHAKVLLMLNRPDAALPLAREAADMAERLAGAGSMAHVASLAGVSEAQVQLGQPRDGLATAEGAVAAAAQTGGGPPATVAAIALGRAQAAAGDGAAARATLARAEAAATAMGPAAARLVQSIADIRARYRV
jgi:non-specific serine/threonine protein kinase/serine/threonine-protein kinase